MHTAAGFSVAGLGIEVDFIGIEHHVACRQLDLTAQFSDRSVHFLCNGFDVGVLGWRRILPSDAGLELQREIRRATYLW